MKDRVKTRQMVDVHVSQINSNAGQLPHRAKVATLEQVAIETGDIVAALQQKWSQDGSDIAAMACEQNFHDSEPQHDCAPPHARLRWPIVEIWLSRPLDTQFTT